MKKQGPDEPKIELKKTLGEMSLDELRAEHERLEIQHLRLTVNTLQGKHDQRVRELEAQQVSLDDANKQILAEQSICRHKTGGKDMAGILAGDGAKGGASVLQHVYNNGDIGLMCTRCTKQVFMPGTRLQKACAPSAFQEQKADPEERKRQMAEYKEWLSWPTWNSASGSQTHLIKDLRA